MAIVLRLVGLAATVSGWVGIALGALFSLWFGWNFKDFWARPHHHGDPQWGVIAAIFYAAPAVVLLSAGGLLVLLGRFL